MNDHQRKMARKGGQACGYATGGVVLDDDDADAALDREDLDAEDEERRNAKTQEELAGEYLASTPADQTHALLARHRAKDKAQRSNLRANETRPQRKRREAEEAFESAQDKLDDLRQERRDYAIGRKAKI